MVFFLADVRGSAEGGGFPPAAPGRPSLIWGPFAAKARRPVIVAFRRSDGRSQAASLRSRLPIIKL